MGSLPPRNDFRQTEICNLDVTIDVNQNVFRFNISIHNVLSMKVLEAKEKLGKIEPRLFFGKLLDLAQMEKHLTSCAKIHYKE